MRSKARLLICGFGPFPGFPDNPAGQVIERLRAARWEPAGASVRYVLMPTTWAGGPQAALAPLAQEPADGVLLVGVAGRATAFRVETRACNLAAADRPDAEGAHPAEAAVVTGGAAFVAATAPVAEMAAALRKAGLPVEPSDDAGDYLCNYTFYRVLADGRAASTGFLHVPPVQPGLDLDALERGVRTAASAFADALPLVRKETPCPA